MWEIFQHKGATYKKKDNFWKKRSHYVMDRPKYTKKCLEMLSTKQFTIVENDLTKPLESKKQRVLRKLKSKNISKI